MRNQKFVFRKSTFWLKPFMLCAVLLHLTKSYNPSRLQEREFPYRVARIIRTCGISSGNDAWPLGLCCMQRSLDLCPRAQRGVKPPFCWSLELKASCVMAMSMVLTSKLTPFTFLIHALSLGENNSSVHIVLINTIGFIIFHQNVWELPNKITMYAL